jgi:isoleucyl-tRNA synthetase
VLRAGDSPDSVHLASWPLADGGLIDERLSAQMALARRLVELGRSARASALVKVRQPLSRAVIAAPGFAGLSDDLKAQVADELNVRALETLGSSGDELVTHLVKANFRELGRRFGSGTQPVAAAIAAADPEVLAAQLAAAGNAQVQVDGKPVSVGPDEVIVTRVPAAGWAVATEAGETVALEVAITADLRREGLAREFVRLVQDARKSDGLHVSDTIDVRWSAADPDLTTALAEHAALIGAEVLATGFGPVEPGTETEAGTGTGAGAAPFRHDNADLGLTFWIAPA